MRFYVTAELKIDTKIYKKKEAQFTILTAERWETLKLYEQSLSLLCIMKLWLETISDENYILEEKWHSFIYHRSYASHFIKIVYELL